MYEKVSCMDTTLSSLTLVNLSEIDRGGGGGGVP